MQLYGLPVVESNTVPVVNATVAPMPDIRIGRLRVKMTREMADDVIGSPSVGDRAGYVPRRRPYP